MKKHVDKIKRFGFIKSWMVVSCLVILGATAVGINSMNGASAAAATLSISPSSGSYTTGQTITAIITENSSSEAVNTVGADLTYPSSKLQFVSINGNSSGFSIDAGSSGGGGVVNISRGSSGGVTGSQQVATVTFTVLAAGSSAINFQPSCVGSNDTNCSLVTDATTGVNIISGTTGANYSLATPVVTPSPSPSPTPTPTPSPSPSPKPAGTTSYSSSSQTKSTSTSITTPSSTTPVTVPDGSAVQVNQPVTVQPATVQEEGVASIQYYLNGKLVHTSLSPPYSYKVDTTKLLNGTYSLKAKTLYSSGKTSTTTETLHVANPLSARQVWLFFKSYLLIPIIILILGVVGFILFMKFKDHHNPFGKPTGHNGGGGDGSFKDQYAPQPSTPVIKPTTVVVG